MKKLKFGNRENQLDDSNTEIIKTFEKRALISKTTTRQQKFLKLIELHTSKIFGDKKNSSNGINVEWYQPINSELKIGW